MEHFLNAKHAAEAFYMLDDDKDGQASLRDVRAALCTIFRCCSCHLVRTYNFNLGNCAASGSSAYIHLYFMQTLF